MHIDSGSGGQMGTFWGQSLKSYDEAIQDAVAAANKALQTQLTSPLVFVKQKFKWLLLPTLLL